MMLLAEMEVDTFSRLIDLVRCQIHVSTIIEVSNRLSAPLFSSNFDSAPLLTFKFTLKSTY